MSPERELRRRIGAARRVVVKIGSSAITSFGGGIRRPQLDALADVCQARMAAGSDVFVVSSGAIGAGMSPLGMTVRPSTLAAKQAAASVGQLELARAWGDSFARYDRVVGQVLLTAGDIGRRESAATSARARCSASLASVRTASASIRAWLSSATASSRLARARS